MKEEKDGDVNCGSDIWLRQSFLMDCEDVKVESDFDESLATNTKQVSNIKSEVKQESAAAFELHDAQQTDWRRTEIENAQNENQSMKSNNSNTVVKRKKNTGHTHKNQKATSSLIEEAPISKTRISGMCTFKCSDCSGNFQAWQTFFKHMKIQHKKHIKMSEHENFLTKVFTHICRVCSMKLLCDTIFLLVHMRKRHKLGMIEYKEKYNLEKESTTSLIVAEATVSKNASPGKCTFKCSECSCAYTCWKNFSSHMKHRHKIRVKMFESEKYLSKTTVHVCKICSTKLLSESTFLSDHMKSKHKLTITEYRRKYSIQTASKVSMTVQENLSKSVNFGRNKILKKYYSKVLEATKNQKTITQNTTEESYDTFSSNTENNFDSAKKTMLVRAEVPLIENATSGMCIFKCSLCTFQNTNWCYFARHMKRQHSKTAKAFEYEEYLSKAFVHICKVCSCKVICDTVFMANHFQQHGLSLREYRQQ